MKHKVVINVSSENKQKAPVLKAALLTLPRRIVQFLFGEYTQIYLISPGKTIESVYIKEVQKGEYENEQDKITA